MKLKIPTLKSLFHGMLLTLIVALLAIEMQMVAGHGFTNVLAADEPAAAVDPAPASSSALTPAELEDEQLVCVTAMRPFMEKRREEFATFINQHFKSKLPTSELLPSALERLRRYRDEVRGQLNSYGPQGKKNAAIVARENGACRDAVTQEYQMVKDLLKNHIMENAYAKKSTRLLDKYKEINTQLNALNFDVAQLYANFSIFSQKLPCYARQCQ